VARFAFPVLAMDVAVAPADRIPRMVVSDGDQIYMYKIVDQRMEPEWTKSVRFLGRTISLQLADLDGDGTLEVVGNRYNERVGLPFPRLATKNGAPPSGGKCPRFPLRPRSHVHGVKQTLWAQRYNKTIFNLGQAERVIIKGKLIMKRPSACHRPFGPWGGLL
jgi:hypothetical protein